MHSKKIVLLSIPTKNFSDALVAYNAAIILLAEVTTAVQIS